jgi:hypothetical protein
MPVAIFLALLSLIVLGSVMIATIASAVPAQIEKRVGALHASLEFRNLAVLPAGQRAGAVALTGPGKSF